jgi:hypothetical protein
MSRRSTDDTYVPITGVTRPAEKLMTTRTTLNTPPRCPARMAESLRAALLTCRERTSPCTLF